MLTAQPSQFKLADDGSILYQPDPTNPLPGEAVARVRKGQRPLAPEIDMIDATLNGIDKAAAKDALTGWLKGHIATVLETLKGLEDTDALSGPVRGICFQLAEAMGIVPRENLEDLIKDLDQDMRQSLRARQVRLGPVLVFLPALNKPAAVRLRALLWSLWNDRVIPAANVPPDGAVSVRVDQAAADRRFFQAIGYPVFGPRAIRIDMLDRVISAVYDKAKDGKFRAEHKMAEWLGCGIDDLYEVLRSMGHRRIGETLKNEKPAAVQALSVAAETPVEAVTDAVPDAVKAPGAKPELAEFWLKKGKAFEKPKSRPSHKKESEKPGEHKSGRDKKPRRDDIPKMISASAQSKPEDSPFAILQQLKAKKDASGS